jgi:hypothetical protein
MASAGVFLECDCVLLGAGQSKLRATLYLPPNSTRRAAAGFQHSRAPEMVREPFSGFRMH